MTLIRQLLEQINEDERRAGEKECFIGHEFSQADLRNKLSRALNQLGLRPYFADKEITGEFILHKVCRKILVTRASIVDLTRANPNVYFELGVALGLNKPVFIVLKEEATVSPLLENFVKLRFSSYVNLESELVKEAPEWLKHSLEHHLLYNNHCHFVNLLCSDRRRIIPQRELLIVDQTKGIKAQGVPHIAVDPDFQSEVLTALSAFHFTVVTLDSLEVIDKFRLCDYCRQLRISKIVLCHLTPNTVPDAYLLLGLVIGLGIPIICAVHKVGITDPLTIVPSMLRGLDILVYEHYGEIGDKLGDIVEAYLNRLHKTTSIPKKLPFANVLRRFTDNTKEAADHSTNSELVAQSLSDLELFKKYLEADTEITETIYEPDWLAAQELLDTGKIITCKVIGYNKGGLTIEFRHLKGFLPASHVIDMPRNMSEDQRRMELEGFIGSDIRLKVIEVDRSRRRLVMSQILAEREYRDSRREALFSTLKVGDIIEGEVRNLRPFGSFIDIGGADGLLHVSEITWSTITHPREVLNVGDKIQVQVIRLDPKEQRIALSRKRALPNPWTNIEQRYKVGDVVPAIVSRVVDFGAFAQLESGVEGLIHISELADISVSEPLNTVKIDDKILVKILRVDSKRQRIGLSRRQASNAPNFEAEP